MSKSKIIILLFLLSQVPQTCGVYADNKVLQDTHPNISCNALTPNKVTPVKNSEIYTNVTIANVNEWEVTLDGTTVKINDYIGTGNTEIKVPSLEDFKEKYPVATEISITKKAIQSSIRDKKVTAFICDSPTLCADADMSRAFSFSNAPTWLKTIDLSGLNTNNVVNMESMFDGCIYLKDLNVSHFNTSNVIDMECMFRGCVDLESLDVSSFDTSKVTNMKKMFSSCLDLINLDVSQFNTNSVNNMERMFDNCQKLSNLKLGVTRNFKYGLLSTPSLKCLTIPKGSDLTNSMFKSDVKKWIATSSNQNYTNKELMSLYDGKKSTSEDMYFREQNNLLLIDSNVTRNVGDIYGEAELRDNIASIIDESGSQVNDKTKIKIIAKDQNNSKIALTNLTKKPGIYKIIFDYNNNIAVETLTVKELKSSPQLLYLGGQGIGHDKNHQSGFARLTLKVENNKVFLSKNSNYQFHWGGWKTSKYVSVKLTNPTGNILYEHSWKGNDNVKGNFGTFAQYDFPEGCRIEIYHAEGPWHRFSTSDGKKLKTKLNKVGYTYIYEMKNNQLVLKDVK